MGYNKRYDLSKIYVFECNTKYILSYDHRWLIRGIQIGLLYEYNMVTFSYSIWCINVACSTFKAAQHCGKFQIPTYIR